MTDDAPIRDRRRLGAIYGAVIAISAVFLIDLCGAIFACGCRSLWSGASALCNVHAATPPHCPWCAHPLWGGAVAFFCIAAAQATALFAPTRLGIGARVLLAAGASPIVGGIVGWIQGHLFGYWS